MATKAKQLRLPDAYLYMRENAMKTETTVPVFDPKPTNAQLTALVLSKVDEAPHVDRKSVV